MLKVELMSLNNISTERLQINEITESDFDIIFKVDSIPECAEYNTIGIPEDIEVTRKLYMSYLDDQKNELRTKYCWIVQLKTGEQIGVAGMSDSLDRFKIGEIYYKLIPEFWGKGYGTEVSKTLIKFGFEVLKLHRVEAGVATGNHASIRVLEKSGMLREGLHRKILPIRGKWIDNYHYAIVEDEYESS